MVTKCTHSYVTTQLFCTMILLSGYQDLTWNSQTIKQLFKASNCNFIYIALTTPDEA